MHHLNTDLDLRDKLRDRARELCRQGFSYKQISAELNVNKSTLSGWCSDLVANKRKKELTPDEIATLTAEFAVNTRAYMAACKFRLPVDLVIEVFAQIRKRLKDEKKQAREARLASVREVVEQKKAAKEQKRLEKQQQLLAAKEQRERLAAEKKAKVAREKALRIKKEKPKPVMKLVECVMCEKPFMTTTNKETCSRKCQDELAKYDDM
jgi:hypothetical protein